MALAIAEAGYPLHTWAWRAGSLDALAQLDYTGHDDLGASVAMTGRSD